MNMTCVSCFFFVRFHFKCCPSPLTLIIILPFTITSSRRRVSSHSYVRHHGLILNLSDTRILQDVERAIKLKAQREARVREKHISIPLYGRHPIPNLPSGDSSLHPALHPRHSPSNGQLFLPPTIDFGPSIARDTILQHPVPSSVDNGRSLDWSHVATGDRADRRWSLTMSKRKNNDGTPSLARTTDQIQKLDKLYAGKCFIG